ncbi:MAG: (Fe-S)-binding protein, partial [Dehalococcoidia bacterium]
PSLPQELPAYDEARYKVGFFVGCAQDLFFSPACRASIEVLRHNGCQVVTFPGQVCCGKPLSAYGQQEAARELARRNLTALESASLDAVVTDCATCGSFLRGYPELLEGETKWAERAAALGHRVMEVSQFLSAIPLREGRNEMKLRATYHIPCHLGRGLGGGEAPYRILEAVPGVEVKAMAEADACCGGAGDYLFRHPHLSHHILDRKMASIADTGASVVVTSCPACRLQLLYGLRRHGIKAQVAYPQELLLRSYQHLP